MTAFTSSVHGSKLDHSVPCHPNVAGVAAGLQIEIQPDDGEPFLADARIGNRLVLPTDLNRLDSGLIGNRQANGLTLLRRNCRNQQSNDVKQYSWHFHLVELVKLKLLELYRRNIARATGPKRLAIVPERNRFLPAPRDTTA